MATPLTAADTQAARRRVVADVSVELYVAVRTKTVELHVDLRDFVAAALVRYLATQGWEDARGSVPAPQKPPKTTRVCKHALA
jgi:hypothetical protein